MAPGGTLQHINLPGGADPQPRTSTSVINRVLAVDIYVGDLKVLTDTSHDTVPLILTRFASQTHSKSGSGK